jgi:RNA-binding protein
MTASKVRRRIKRELSGERPTIWVGKEGVTSRIVEEINRQLKKRKMVKVKILKTALKERKARDIANIIAQKTESVLIDVRGHTVMLYKKHKKSK